MKTLRNNRIRSALLSAALFCFGCRVALSWSPDPNKPLYYSIRGELFGDSRKTVNFDTWGSIEMYSTATVVGKSANAYAFGVVAPNSWYPQSGHDLTYQLIVTTQGYVGIATASPAGLFTVGNGTLTVLSNGSVGIGTASPETKLVVSGSGIWDDGAAIGLNNTGTDGKNWTIFSTNSSFDQGAGKLLFYRNWADGGGGTMVLDSSGNVGIGTTNPTQTLAVNGTFTYAITQNDVTSSRAFGTIYQNTTGRIMYVSIVSNHPADGTTVAYCAAGSPPTTAVSVQSGHAAWGTSNFFIVPPGYYYKATIDSNITLGNWIEWY